MPNILSELLPAKVSDILILQFFRTVADSAFQTSKKGAKASQEV